MGDGTGRGKVLIDNKPFPFLISVFPLTLFWYRMQSTRFHSPSLIGIKWTVIQVVVDVPVGDYG